MVVAAIQIQSSRSDLLDDGLVLSTARLEPYWPEVHSASLVNFRKRWLPNLRAKCRVEASQLIVNSDKRLSMRSGLA